DVRSAYVMKRCTFWLFLARAVITELALTFRLLIVWASLASRFSRLSVSARAGSARRSAVWRSSERAATAAPSSLMIRLRRSRYGICMMFWTRSAGIVDWVWLAGIVAPDLSTGPELPGWQSTKYSPISDWGRVWQKASEWNWPKPPWVTWTVMTACSVFWSRPMPVIEPAFTPATLNSPPLTRS